MRKSIDARKKQRILAVYIVDVEVADEADVLARCEGTGHIEQSLQAVYVTPKYSSIGGKPSPVVVGSGPCGLFAALLLAEAGARPILIERGREVAARVRDVQAFWREGVLHPESNVPFGEGGAGTFSDGKLTTQIKDRSGRVRKILAEMVAAGALEEILYDARPHIGTDRLVGVVKNLRETILSLGGQVRFETKLPGLVVRDGRITGADQACQFGQQGDFEHQVGQSQTGKVARRRSERPQAAAGADKQQRNERQHNRRTGPAADQCAQDKQEGDLGAGQPQVAERGAEFLDRGQFNEIVIERAGGCRRTSRR